MTKGKKGYHISGYKQSLTEDLSKIYGISCRIRTTTHAEEAWRTAKKSLDNNHPLLISVDRYYLPPYPVSYQRVHGGHNIILNGYDEKESKSYIIDWWPPHFFKKAVDIEALKQARNSLNPKDPDNPLFSGFPIENRWLDIEYPSYHIKLDENLIKKIILENIEEMLGNNSKKNYFQGIKGIRTFAQDILAWITCSDETSVAIRAERAFLLLWSVQGQRILHSEFLSNISKRLGKPELRKTSEELAKIAQSWQVARNMFFKASIKELKTMLPRISTRLLNIADREEKALIRLRDIILSS